MAYIIKNCLNCYKEFKADKREHNRGNAKFCTQSCSTTFNNLQKSTIINICRQCGREFNTVSKNTIYCSDVCKQRNYRDNSKGDISIKALYKQLSHLPCQICGWIEATRDLHHIIPVSKGGKNNIDNLITVCPNHHRMIHSKLITETELLAYKSQ